MKGRSFMIDRQLNYGRKNIEEFIRYAKPYQTVLDIGAGDGKDLMLARKHNRDAILIGIEAYSEFAKVLHTSGIIVHSIDVEKNRLPLNNESVDLIIMNQIIEHTKEIFWIFHEVTRVLRTGGHLIMGVPNLASLHNRLLLSIGKQPSSIKSCSAHIRGFTRPDLLNFFEQCFPNGYKLKDFRGSNFYPFPPTIATPLAKVFPTMAWSIFFLFEKQFEYNSSGFLRIPKQKELQTNFFLGDN
jgi:SAM-dependent methyltransferase